MTEAPKNEVILSVEEKAKAALALYKTEDDYADVRPQDRVTPRLRLQQMTSPGVAAGKTAAGDFALDDTDPIIRRGATTKAIFLMHWLQWVQFNPNRNCPKNERVLARSVDPNGELAMDAGKYTKIMNSEGKETMKTTESYNFVLLLPTIGFYDTFYLLSFQRSSHKIGKNLINKMMGFRQPTGDKMPMFSHMFDLSAEFHDEGPSKKYFTPSLSNAIETPMEQWPKLVNLVTGLRTVRQAMMQRELERETADDAVPGVDDKPNF